MKYAMPTSISRAVIVALYRGIRRGQQRVRSRGHPEPGGRLAGRRERRVRAAAMHGIELGHGAVDLEMENIRPVVVAGEVVPKLHLDAEVEVAFGIENALLRAHGSGDDAA